ncbi:MAG TPA: hypothetical protein VF306_14620 [Pirellulales bacterium]
MALSTVPDRFQPAKERFEHLVEQWKQFESPSSSAMDLAMHPAYQQTIAMEPAAIPRIIDELDREPDHWFWALHCLTGGLDPVPATDRGDLETMSAAWIKWASENGYSCPICLSN